MPCNTAADLHPFQSTHDLDGMRADRETVQDIAWDGDSAGKKPKPPPKRKPVQLS